MIRFRIASLVLAATGLGAIAPVGKTQAATETISSSSGTGAPSAATTRPQLDLTYNRPTEKTKLHNYLFDTFGPYSISASAIVGAVDQAYKTPPEWGQGAIAYGERVGSYFGIAAVTTTTRYALAEALREDTLYYRCECKGFVRRMDHAVISTVTARHGQDGRRRLSLPALFAPYAGAMTAVYAWYPNRFGAKDGLRMGNYALLAFAGINIAREFIYGGPHTLIHHLHHSSPASQEPAAKSNP